MAYLVLKRYPIADWIKEGMRVYSANPFTFQVLVLHRYAQLSVTQGQCLYRLTVATVHTCIFPDGSQAVCSDLESI
jgi:hypothetical protein